MTDNVIPFRPRQAVPAVRTRYTLDVPALMRTFATTAICLFLSPFLWYLDALREPDEPEQRERRRRD